MAMGDLKDVGTADERRFDMAGELKVGRTEGDANHYIRKWLQMMSWLS
jgi:hypothetical protein